MIPKGRLLIIGGAEDKGGEKTVTMQEHHEFEHFEILKELISGSTMKLEVITTASEEPEEVAATYRKAFKDIGYTNVDFMDIRDKAEARKPEYEKRVEKAGVVFFSGGDQLRISTILGGSRLIDKIKERYIRDKHFVVGGTSAGAMAMSRIMICGGGTMEALIDTDLKTSSGLGFLEQCIIDTHFINRGRFGRLSHAIIINPGQLGVGLGEDTALIIRNGTDAECRGSGMVVIVDGENIEQTNIAEAGPGEPVFVENLRVHLLVRNCRFSFLTRELAKPAIAKGKTTSTLPPHSHNSNE